MKRIIYHSWTQTKPTHISIPSIHRKLCWQGVLYYKPFTMYLIYEIYDDRKQWIKSNRKSVWPLVVKKPIGAHYLKKPWISKEFYYCVRVEQIFVKLNFLMAILSEIHWAILSHIHWAIFSHIHWAIFSHIHNASSINKRCKLLENKIKR